uniref:Uncharacterized protein n=1 Tax=Amphimedon queenslandica TaxID=400682 RepID=A0A1X7U314_AMPQE
MESHHLLGGHHHHGHHGHHGHHHGHHGHFGPPPVIDIHSCNCQLNWSLTTTDIDNATGTECELDYCFDVHIDSTAIICAITVLVIKAKIQD